MMIFSYLNRSINFGQFMCSIAETILIHCYFSSTSSYPITGPCLLQYLYPSSINLKQIMLEIGCIEEMRTTLR